MFPYGKEGVEEATAALITAPPTPCPCESQLPFLEENQCSRCPPRPGDHPSLGVSSCSKPEMLHPQVSSHSLLFVLLFIFNNQADLDIYKYVLFCCYSLLKMRDTCNFMGVWLWTMDFKTPVTLNSFGFCHKSDFFTHKGITSGLIILGERWAQRILFYLVSVCKTKGELTPARDVVLVLVAFQLLR